MVNSHYALVLPLWLKALPCDKTLVLEQETFFPSPSPPQLNKRGDGAPTTPSPPPLADLQPLISTLRFVGGLTTENATRLARLRSYQPASPNFGTNLNPISPALRRNLEAYFAPFQEQLNKMVAIHRNCFAEERKKTKKTKMLTHARRR